MAKELNFEGLARLLLSQSRDILFRWLPGGKLVGAEYCCGSLSGERGDSLKINVNKGLWKDFATGDAGGDLVSLYAALNKKSQGEAFHDLSKEFNFEQNGTTTTVAVEAPVRPARPPAPVKNPLETFKHRDHGKPSAVWFYKNIEKEVLFAVARYEAKGGKQILPWSWDERGFWNCKGVPPPRPLFGLEYLKSNPDMPILIVEGEKAACAARELLGDSYIVMTWCNGAQAVNRTDWSPIFGRRVLLWPDADAPGFQAMQAIADILIEKCPEVKLLEFEYED